jgi:hypothetical protein
MSRAALFQRRVGSIRLLGIAATRRSVHRTNGNEVIVSDFSDVARPQGDKRLSTARRRNELDLDRVRGVDVDHRAEIAASQALRRQIGVQHDDVEWLKTH